MLNHTSGSEEKYPHDESVCIILAFKKTRQHEVSNNRLSQKQRAPFAFKRKTKAPALHSIRACKYQATSITSVEQTQPIPE